MAGTPAGHARAIAQQDAAASGGGSTEQSLNAFIAAVLPAHGHRFPALAAAVAETIRLGGQVQGQAFDFGLGRILDGIDLLITARAAGNIPETGADQA